MNVNELIKSDLKTTLLAPKLELIDRWIINEKGDLISVEIENRLEEVVVKVKPVDRHREIKHDSPSSFDLKGFMNKFCSSLGTTGHRVFNVDYNPDTEGRFSINALGYDINLTLQKNQKMSYSMKRLENSIGEEMVIIDCMVKNGTNFSFYMADGFYIMFGDSTINVVYLFNYYDPERKSTDYTIFNVNRPIRDFSIVNYGLEYVGDINFGSGNIDRDKITFDLTAFNEQQNKSFCKGYVACPFIMTSSGIFCQTEMFVPIRKTEILDENTRAVYNYLYRL